MAQFSMDSKLIVPAGCSNIGLYGFWLEEKSPTNKPLILYNGFVWEFLEYDGEVLKPRFKQFACQR